MDEITYLKRREYSKCVHVCTRGDVGDPHVLNRQVSNLNLSAFFPRKVWLLIIVPEGYSFEITKYPLPKPEQQRDVTMILDDDIMVL